MGNYFGSSPTTTTNPKTFIEEERLKEEAEQAQLENVWTDMKRIVCAATDPVHTTESGSYTIPIVSNERQYGCCGAYRGRLVVLKMKGLHCPDMGDNDKAALFMHLVDRKFTSPSGFYKDIEFKVKYDRSKFDHQIYLHFKLPVAKKA